MKVNYNYKGMYHQKEKEQKKKKKQTKTPKQKNPHKFQTLFWHPSVMEPTEQTEISAFVDLILIRSSL